MSSSPNKTLAIAMALCVAASPVTALSLEQPGAPQCRGIGVGQVPLANHSTNKMTEANVTDDEGTLYDIDAEPRRIEVLLDGNSTSTWFPVAADAEIMLNNATASLHELRVGDRVKIAYDLGGEETVVARIVATR